MGSPSSVVPGAEEVVGYDELRLRVREQGQHAVALAKVQALAKVSEAVIDDFKEKVKQNQMKADFISMVSKAEAAEHGVGGVEQVV